MEAHLQTKMPPRARAADAHQRTWNLLPARVLEAHCIPKGRKTMKPLRPSLKRHATEPTTRERNLALWLMAVATPWKLKRHPPKKSRRQPPLRR